MNSLTLGQAVEQDASRPVIVSITMWEKDNYVNFSDSDSQTDYFHGYSLGITHIIDWLTKNEAKVNGDMSPLAQAGTVIRMDVGNNPATVEPKYLKRVERLAKVLGYKIKAVEKKGIYRINEGHDYYSKAPCFYITPYKYTEFFLYDSALISEEQIRIN